MTPSDRERAEMDREAALAMGWKIVPAMFPSSAAPFTFPCVEDHGRELRLWEEDPFDPKNERMPRSQDWSPTTDANDANRLMMASVTSERPDWMSSWCAARGVFIVHFHDGEYGMCVGAEAETEPLAKTKAALALLAWAGRERG